MAFSTSNVGSTYFGNMHVTYGQWAETVDADSTVGTITVTGGQVWLCEFVSQDASGKYTPIPMKYSTTGTAGILTVTVYNLAATTAGRFVIISA